MCIGCHYIFKVHMDYLKVDLCSPHIYRLNGLKSAISPISADGRL